ncbi:MAG: hypothetical protein Q8R81_15700 [Novosphingobium sp.]|uniref:hypothetical protein n=1 Tax=Novosphingobium sp. TaxID=1874826 RepID=UPI0027357013|nr:hypothetical protein [Novosphingobium sp.]MDP3551824.1 hypothetical protein [Novosphingobium sp.]
MRTTTILKSGAAILPLMFGVASAAHAQTAPQADSAAEAPQDVAAGDIVVTAQRRVRGDNYDGRLSGDYDGR